MEEPLGATAYLSQKCRMVEAPEKGGYSILAASPIAEGELIAMWSGRIVTGAELPFVAPELRHRAVQVEDDLYLLSLSAMEGADMINHSCDPNAKLSGQLAIVARRPIGAGEEITIDYATCDGSPYDEFECHCGSPLCRGRITGNDWQNPDLWMRYGDSFSPYLQRRINQMRTRRPR